MNWRSCTWPTIIFCHQQRIFRIILCQKSRWILLQSRRISSSTRMMSLSLSRSKNSPYIRLEKGVKAIFVPHSAGIYVCINLNSVANNYITDNNSQGNYDSNYENKFFKCNAILSLEYFDSDLKELLM